MIIINISLTVVNTIKSPTNLVGLCLEALAHKEHLGFSLDFVILMKPAVKRLFLP